MNKLTYNKLRKVAKSDSILDDPDVAKALDEAYALEYDDNQLDMLTDALDNLGYRGRQDKLEHQARIAAGTALIEDWDYTMKLINKPYKARKEDALQWAQLIKNRNADHRDFVDDIMKERSTKGRSKGTLGSYALAALLGGGMGGYIASNGPRRDQAAVAGIGALGGLLFNYLRRKTYYGKNISV